MHLGLRCLNCLVKFEPRADFKWSFLSVVWQSSTVVIFRKFDRSSVFYLIKEPSKSMGFHVSSKVNSLPSCRTNGEIICSRVKFNRLWERISPLQSFLKLAYFASFALNLPAPLLLFCLLLSIYFCFSKNCVVASFRVDSTERYVTKLRNSK